MLIESTQGVGAGTKGTCTSDVTLWAAVDHGHQTPRGLLCVNLGRTTASNAAIHTQLEMEKKQCRHD